MRVLVVEDNAALRHGIALALEELFSGVETAERGDRAVERLLATDAPPYDLVLTDLQLPGASGMQVLAAALERDPETAVLVMTAFGSVDVAVEAMRAGAFDFLEKPVDLEQLEMRLRRAAEHRRLVDEVGSLRAERAGRRASETIIGAKGSLRDVTELALRVADTRSTVLLTGETGTGKELIADLIHAASGRRAGPFVKVNCAALPEPLLESELFGHERGAFTGADRRRRGRFEEASGGTLFLDEIGDLTGVIQAKLLRVLQDQEFHRLGGDRPVRTDARILVATHRDLAGRVRDGHFREDLFFRLNVIEVRLPPLRDRPDDLVPLAQHFLETLPSGPAQRPRGFSDAAVAKLRAHLWPGNVRELRNAVERALLLTDQARVDAGDLTLIEPAADAGWRPELPPEPWSLADVERALVIEALRRSDYVQKEASRRLGVSRRKLNYMIRRMGITHPGWRRNRGTAAPEPQTTTADPSENRE